MSHKNHYNEEDLRRVLAKNHKHDQRAKNRELRDVGAASVHRVFGVIKRFPEAIVIGAIVLILAALPPLAAWNSFAVFVFIFGYLAFRESRSRPTQKVKTESSPKAERADTELIESLRSRLPDVPVDGQKLFDLMRPETRSASEVQGVYRAIKAAEATPAS